MIWPKVASKVRAYGGLSPSPESQLGVLLEGQPWFPKKAGVAGGLLSCDVAAIVYDGISLAWTGECSDTPGSTRRWVATCMRCAVTSEDSKGRSWRNASDGFGVVWQGHTFWCSLVKVTR